MSGTHRSPFNRLFTLRNVLTPLAIEGRVYPDNITYRAAYIFGIRVARWNASK